MESTTEKYVSPGVIVPLETNAYLDLKMSAMFVAPFADLGMSATFVNAANPVGSTIYGTASTVAQGSSDLAITYSAAVGSYITGFAFSGDTDGVYKVFLNGRLVMRFSTNIVVPNIDYKFPTSLLLVAGDVVDVIVTNVGDQTSDYQATVIGSFPG